MTDVMGSNALCNYHNVCARTRVLEWRVFYLVKSPCSCSRRAYAALRQATITPYSVPLLILGVKNTHRLLFIYTSKGPQAGRQAGGELLTSIKYFCPPLFFLSPREQRQV